MFYGASATVGQHLRCCLNPSNPFDTDAVSLFVGPHQKLGIQIFISGDPRKAVVVRGSLCGAGLQGLQLLDNLSRDMTEEHDNTF